MDTTQKRTIGALVGIAIVLVLLLFSCSVGFGGKDDDGGPLASADPTPTETADPVDEEPSPAEEPTQPAPETTPVVPDYDDVYVPPGSPVVPEPTTQDDMIVVPIVDNPTPEAPPATCETDPSLCPPPPPPPPAPTCETDPSLCPPPPPPADTTAPSCPPNLAVSEVSAREAMVLWDRSTDNVAVTGYTVILNGEVVGHSTDGQFLLQELSPATEYTVRVVAYDAAGNVSAECGSVTFRTKLLPDLLPPSIPGNVACTVVDETTIEVTFDESTDNVRVDHYTVFANGDAVGDFAKSPAEVIDLMPGTEYQLRVAAVDGAGNTSLRSEAVTCTTVADTEAPTAPTVTVDSTTDVTADLSWAGATDNVAVTEYLVFQDGTQIATVTDTTYTAEDLTPSTTYVFTVVAADASGNQSPASNEATGTTLAPDTTAPAVPAGLVASNVTSTGFTLTWDPSTDDRSAAAAITYEVLIDGASVGTVTGTTTLDVDGLLPDTTYAVTVTATDEAGNTSAASAALSVTTEPLVQLTLAPRVTLTQAPEPAPEVTEAPETTETTEPTGDATTEEEPQVDQTTATAEPTDTRSTTPAPEPEPEPSPTETATTAAPEETTEPTTAP